MLAIGLRLLEERKRLKMSQVAMAAKGSVTKMTQMKYEQGKSMPNAGYLSLLAAEGLDVLYVVTGTRIPVQSSADGTQAVQLNQRQQALIKNYDAADEVGKTFIEGTANLATQPKAKRASGGKR